ncbi:MAG: transcription elongation factor Spt5 [Candidatus Iainarchaeum archaeon]|uniref:Transcription elongation factor Spt5 n=1 Tax=Candidatus Iainarchaeum sp. TaxID=3101447 RepID=A0A7T9DKQ7_9ARCH|nr:MAG: transcription elongation factor Spt5 [Candidatus Diapherotrites archaeon]
MIYTVRTTVNQEAMVADILAAKSKKEGLEVWAIALFPGLRGYIMVEADHENTVQRAIAGVNNVKGRGVVAGEVKIEEIANVFSNKPLMETIQAGMKVEIIAGSFKGEKARVVRVNDTKEEVVVEILEAMVKIPLTLPAEHIRVMKE